MNSPADTLNKAIADFEKSKERIADLEYAENVLSEQNEFAHAVRCKLVVTQGTAHSVSLFVGTELVRPFFQAELIKERDKFRAIEGALRAASETSEITSLGEKGAA